MNIIIEGPDGAGKTTLANQLAEALNLHVMHFSAPLNDNSQFNMYREVLLSKRNTILDRAWYSDMVYGPIFRGRPEITKELMWELERCAEDTIVVFCTGPVEAMWEAALRRGETFVKNFGQYKRICAAYQEIMCWQYHEIPVHIREATWLTKEN